MTTKTPANLAKHLAVALRCRLDVDHARLAYRTASLLEPDVCEPAAEARAETIDGMLFIGIRPATHTSA